MQAMRVMHRCSVPFYRPVRKKSADPDEASRIVPEAGPHPGRSVAETCVSPLLAEKNFITQSRTGRSVDTDGLGDGGFLIRRRGSNELVRVLCIFSRSA